LECFINNHLTSFSTALASVWQVRPLQLYFVGTTRFNSSFFPLSVVSLPQRRKKPCIS